MLDEATKKQIARDALIRAVERIVKQGEAKFVGLPQKYKDGAKITLTVKTSNEFGEIKYTYNPLPAVEYIVDRCELLLDRYAADTTDEAVLEQISTIAFGATCTVLYSLRDKIKGAMDECVSDALLLGNAILQSALAQLLQPLVKGKVEFNALKLIDEEVESFAGKHRDFLVEGLRKLPYLKTSTSPGRPEKLTEARVRACVDSRREANKSATASHVARDLGAKEDTLRKAARRYGIEFDRVD